MSATDASPRAKPERLPLAIVALLVVLAVIYHESSFTLLAYEAPRAPPLVREYHNVFTWTQRKTGSSSTTRFSINLAKSAGLEYLYTGPYAFTPMREPVEFIGTQNCTIFAGHLRVPPVHARQHEAEQAAMITSNRDVHHFMASKFFFKLKHSYNGDTLKRLNDSSSEDALIWYLVWDAYDPCETLRYYDGLPGCDLDTFRERAEAIAARFDCVIDTEDAQPDADAICAVMKVEDCPQFTQQKVRVWNAASYDKLLKIPQVAESMRVIAGHLQVFRDVLMKRQCRKVLRGGKQVETGSWTPAKWPTPQCGK